VAPVPTAAAAPPLTDDLSDLMLLVLETDFVGGGGGGDEGCDVSLSISRIIASLQRLREVGVVTLLPSCIRSAALLLLPPPLDDRRLALIVSSPNAQPLPAAAAESKVSLEFLLDELMQENDLTVAIESWEECCDPFLESPDSSLEFMASKDFFRSAMVKEDDLEAGLPSGKGVRVEEILRLSLDGWTAAAASSPLGGEE